MSKLTANWLLLVALIVFTAFATPIWQFNENWGYGAVIPFFILTLLAAARLMARYFE